ncbi:MAG: hypothetical protein PVG65_00345 [Candidatus Thorarchaeota archaeon]|jgi:hypothetical protein
MLYFVIAAVPAGFQLENYLSLREMGNIFNKEFVSLDDLKLIAQSIELSPYVMLSSTTSENFEYLIKILEDLGLVISQKSDFTTMTGFSEGENERIQKHGFVCVNIANLSTLSKYEKVLEQVVALEEYGTNEEMVKKLQQL